MSNTTVTVITGLGSSDLEVSYGSRGPAGAAGAAGAAGQTGQTGAQGDRAGLKYRFDDQTNAGAPQHGHLKFNNSNLSLVTRITISNLDFDGNNMGALFALIDDSNSTNKARVIIRSNSNSDTSHFVFLVSGISDENNHYHIDGTYVTGSAFADDEIVTFDYYVTGDKGTDALWNYRGDFNSNAYSDWFSGDVASYSGSLWYCLLDFYPSSIGDTIYPGTNPTVWELIASKGDTGETGATGATGPEPSLTIVDNANTSITLSDTDNNKVVRCTASTAVTIIVPSTLAAGFSCMVIQAGAGQVTFQAGSGTTLNSFGNLLKTAGQHAPASLIRVASGMYNLSGNLI